MRPGATGKPVPGYEARIVDDDGNEAAARHRRPARGARPDRLPLSRRRAPERNTCRTAGTSPATPTSMDDDGYFWYQARSDDMIISAGYNIAGPGGRGGAARRMPRSPNAAWSARPTRSAARSSRPTSCCAPGIARRRGDDASAAGLRQGDGRALQVSARDRIRRRAADAPQTGKLQRFELRRRAAEARRQQARVLKGECPCRERTLARARVACRVAAAGLAARRKATPTASRRAARFVFVGGMVGWDDAGEVPEGLRRAGAAGAGKHRRGAGRGRRARRSTSCGMTWYVLDMDEYLTARPALGAAYREVLGDHFPAMALVRSRAWSSRTRGSRSRRRRWCRIDLNRPLASGPS